MVLTTILPSPSTVPMAEYHGMDHYIESVEGKSWKALAGLRNAGGSEKGVEGWFKDKNPIGLTITTIEWLNDALFYVLNKCLDGASWLISRSFANSFTLMDQLAYILRKGIDISKTTSGWVLHLMRRIMQVLGLGKVVEKAEISLQFVRYILTTLQAKISHFTQSVLSKVLVQGRAI